MDLPPPDELRHDAQARPFFELVLEALPYSPNEGQEQVIAAFAHFLYRGGPRSAFLLNGYAGTGKTSLAGAVVRALLGLNIKTVLLAPTGRAAQVFSEYAGHQAYTIHRRIYRQDNYMGDGFSLAENKHKDTIFIVDEASMIANAPGEAGATFGSGRLLDDLISYVYAGTGCRLMLMGDTAQLPPVGQLESPALSTRTLSGYGLMLYDLQLKRIARQALDSGILHNATLVRDIIDDGVLVAPQLEVENRPDIESITGEFLLETLNDCYDAGGLDETIIITRSNRRATLFNAGVRNQILYREDELAVGDLLLVAKNNYYWAADNKEVDFIANGDRVEVLRIWGEEERLYGLRFVNATVRLTDRDGLELDVKIILDSLFSDTPALTREQADGLFNGVMDTLEGDRRSRLRKLKEDPYFNALQVKFAYCVTCHKAQGGQWQNVFIDLGSIMPDAFAQLDFLRWLYTALTRARRHVYLVNTPRALLTGE
ncbi:MAG: AAA family ATPase [Muribaculaceae bacterium]|nr:AAA family ATPase [Muribaculaceae bacterium]